MKYPKVIATSVVRSTKKGESHGGIYIVDLNTEFSSNVYNWDNQEISWTGRGGDRGLRGISFYQNFIIAAASDEIFFFDKNFNISRSIKNQYLKDCHEICILDDVLYLSSTGFDCILCYDLPKQSFTTSYRIEVVKIFGFKRFKLRSFDPNIDNEIGMSNTIHLNNVSTYNGDLYFSGANANLFFNIVENGRLKKVCKIPEGTHNVKFIDQDVLLLNDTDMNSVTIVRIGERNKKSVLVPQFDLDKLQNTDIPSDHARASFARGLCFNENFIIAGCSPATITIYNRKTLEKIKSVQLSTDIRNAIHGLEIMLKFSDDI